MAFKEYRVVFVLNYISTVICETEIDWWSAFISESKSLEALYEVLFHDWLYY